MKVRAVGIVTMRSMVGSASNLVGYGLERQRVIERVSRLAIDAGPAALERSVGMVSTSVTVWPGTWTSANPTSDAADPRARSLLVCRMVILSLENVAVGNDTTCPDAVRDSGVRSTLRIGPPSKESPTFVIQRVTEPF